MMNSLDSHTPPSRFDLPILGMSCASCARRLETALNASPRRGGSRQQRDG